MKPIRWRNSVHLCWLFASSITASAFELPIDKSVCEIAGAPSHYEHVKVSIPAVLVHNGADVLYLADSGCPKLGIDIQFVSDAKKIPSLVELSEAIRTSGMYGHPPVEISGRFLGDIRMAPKGAWPESILELERVENLHIKNLD